jgi:hypothetical protein
MEPMPARKTRTDRESGWGRLVVTARVYPEWRRSSERRSCVAGTGLHPLVAALERLRLLLALDLSTRFYRGVLKVTKGYLAVDLRAVQDLIVEIELGAADEADEEKSEGEPQPIEVG